MPVFRSGKGQAPDWCELEFFDIVELPAGGAHTFGRMGEKEKLVVGSGRCRIVAAGAPVDAQEGAVLDLVEPGAHFEATEAAEPCTLIRMAGRWGEECGGCGLFTGAEADEPANRGDPRDYERNTSFDNHYHDCDEYWIVFEGRGVAVSEGRHYEVGPGDCVATGMGRHHDFPDAHEPVRAVYFETTMEGQKRPGHLWEHTHGAAAPVAERVQLEHRVACGG